MTEEFQTNAQDNKQVSSTVVTIIILLVLAFVIWFVVGESQDEETLPTPLAVIPEVIIEEVKAPEPEAIQEVVETPEEIIETPVEVVEEPIQPTLPNLDESDTLVVEKLPDITWRKELLKLLVTEDAIRRFVVFTDNFSQGNLSYDHSPFVVPVERFSASESHNELDTDNNNKTLWLWDEATTRRFSLYVDLLRSIDSGELVAFYVEIKPLIDQAFQELGYPEEDFTNVLQSAIIRVLDMDIPSEPTNLTRPSVMYKFQSDEVEALDDADKLLIRIGKENLLVIKSVLLEINDKLSRAKHG